PGSRPVIDPIPAIEIVQGQLTNFRVTVRDADGNIRGLTVGLAGTDPYDTKAAFYNLNPGLGSLASVNFDGAPTFVTTFTNINYPITSGAPWPSNAQSEYVAARFTGTISIPTNGTYIFWTGSDDGSALYID